MLAWQKAVYMATGVGAVAVPVGGAAAMVAWIDRRRPQWRRCVQAEPLGFVICAQGVAGVVFSGAMVVYDTRRLLRSVRATSQWRDIVRETASYSVRAPVVIGCGVFVASIAWDTATTIKRTCQAAHSR